MIMRIVRLGITFSGFKFVNLFGVLFANKNARISDRDLNHESIHTAQMKELLYVPFYLLYLIEYLVRLFMRGDAYRNISFEREAYKNDNDKGYLTHRIAYSSFKYL